MFDSGERVCSVRRWIEMRSRRYLSVSYSFAFASAFACRERACENGR